MRKRDINSGQSPDEKEAPAVQTGAMAGADVQDQLTDAAAAGQAAPRKRARMLSRRGYFTVQRADLELLKIVCGNPVSGRSVWLALCDLDNQCRLRREPFKVRVGLIASTAGLRYRTAEKVLAELVAGGMLSIAYDIRPGKTWPGGPSTYSLITSEPPAKSAGEGAHKLRGRSANNGSLQMQEDLALPLGPKKAPKGKKEASDSDFSFAGGAGNARQRGKLAAQPRGWFDA